VLRFVESIYLGRRIELKFAEEWYYVQCGWGMAFSGFPKKKRTFRGSQNRIACRDNISCFLLRKKCPSVFTA